MKKSDNNWTEIISGERGWFDLKLSELFNYSYLIYLFVKRDFVIFYKQTILGPLWYVILPIVNTVIFNIIFGRIAKLSTDGIPPFLFYMSGTVVWSYFSSCINGTSTTFVKNANIFGKVYFPRITVPIATVISCLFQFIIQFLLFLGFYLYFISNGAEIRPNYLLLTLPFIILQMGIMALGFGLIISSLTAKYRDLTFAMTFILQMWMYLTPIVYPLSQVPEEYRTIYILNPMTSVVEMFRFAFFDTSTINLETIIMSVCFSIFVLIIGFYKFTRTEKSFIDTV